MQPKKIEEGIIVRPLGVDTLLMQEATCNVHCLNQLAYLVYHYSDGERTPTEIAERIIQNDGLPCTVDAVEIAIEQLVERSLMICPLPEPTPQREVRRREALQQLAAMMAVPVILSLSAGRSSAACFHTNEHNTLVRFGSGDSQFFEITTYDLTCEP
ncbi:MAG: hypothetical protein AABP62_23835 [Planctomycetota bacterium]